MKKTVVLLLFAVNLMATVIIAPNEVGLRPGISGEIGASLMHKRGNTDKNEYYGNVYLSYDNNVSFVTWIAANVAYGESSGVVNENNAFIHLRHIHNLSQNSLAGELFIQDSEDSLKNIRRRLLGGAGLRQRLFEERTYGRAYFGVGAFYEHIDYTTDIDPTERNTRFNTYVAYTLKFADNARLSAAGYYQPKVDDLQDYYLVSNFSLEMLIIAKLYLKVQLSAQYDSRPPADVIAFDYAQETVLLWKFGAEAKK